eukprot:m51a1_g8325 hypothetical protein (650) ;mRNA; r:149523-156217
MSSDNTAAHNDLPGSSEPQESHVNLLPVSDGPQTRQSQSIVPVLWKPRSQSSGEGSPIDDVIATIQDPDAPPLCPNQQAADTDLDESPSIIPVGPLPGGLESHDKTVSDGQSSVPGSPSKPSSPSSERDPSEFEIELFLTPPPSPCAEQQQHKRQREEPDDGAGQRDEEPPLSKRRTTGDDEQISNDGFSQSREVSATDTQGTGERKVSEKDIAELVGRAWRALHEAQELNSEMEEFLMEVGDFLTLPQNPENQHGRDDHSQLHASDSRDSLDAGDEAEVEKHHGKDTGLNGDELGTDLDGHTKDAESEEEQEEQEEQDNAAVWNAEDDEEDVCAPLSAPVVVVDFVNNDWNKWDTVFAAAKKELSEMKNKGARVVRWWVFARSDVIPDTCWNSTKFSKLPSKFLDRVEKAVNYAKSIGLLVYPALMSFDWGKGNHLHPEIISDPEARQSWIDNAIAPLVQRLKSNSGVFAWDLWNEPEWIVATADGGEPGDGCRSFSLADVKALMNGVLSMMRAKGVKQPVSLGSASLKFFTQKKLWNDLDLDFWDFHWYSWATPYFNPLLIRASAAISPSKPIIIGEIMADPSQDSVLASAANTWCNGQVCTDHGRLIKRLAQLGYSGYMPWSWTDSSSPAASYIGSHFTEFASVCP